MDISEILKTVENTIRSAKEREYFLIHEARYSYILEQINKVTNDFALRQAQGKIPRQQRGLRILDVGCFPYHLGAAMEEMGHEVYGISSKHEPIKSTKVVVCNIETDRFPFKDNFFDLVVCTEVLEHLPQSPLHALREMYRVTAPHGNALLTTPNIARSINRAKLLMGKSVTYPLEQVLEDNGKGSNLYHRHNREYTLKELTTLVRLANFSVEIATHFVSYTPFRRRVKLDPLWLKGGKIANYALMMAVSTTRDTLFVLGQK